MTSPTITSIRKAIDKAANAVATARTSVTDEAARFADERDTTRGTAQEARNAG